MGKTTLPGVTYDAVNEEMGNSSAAAAREPVVVDLSGGTVVQVGGAPSAPAKAPTPNAIVTRAQLEAARASGSWTHDDPSTALWLNSTFAAKNVDADTLTATLALHGVVVSAS